MNVKPILLAALALGLGGTLPFCAPAQSQGGQLTHYVDFEKGDDSRDGLTPATAWRRAPGDPAAQGGPARLKLSAGHRIVFAAGVRYRGSIVVNGSGAPGAPIIFESAPGKVPAIIDGSDAATALRACRSAEDCGGASNWAQLTRAEFAAAVPAEAALFTTTQLLTAAQHPNMPDPFYSDEVEHFLKAPGEDLALGRAPLPDELIRRVSSPGERRIAVWTRGNQVRLRDITGFAEGAALFNPEGLKFYTDRPDRVAVVGHPALVDRPGEYAFIDDRRAAVIWLPEGAGAVSVASGRGGFDLRGASHVTIRGLGFENMMGVVGNVRTGVPVQNFLNKGEGVAVENNRFSRLWMGNGQGAITLRGIRGLTITGNAIDTVGVGSGVRLSNVSDVKMSGNSVRRVGRTGMMLMNVVGAEVAQNTITDVQGVHGNGLSVYLDNQNVRVVGNTIAGATRPLTFHGGKGVENSLVFACNLLVGTKGSAAALTSWSSDKPVRGVSIERNVLVGGKMGAQLSGKDLAVTVRGNVSNGITTRGAAGSDWTMADNRSIGGQAQAPPERLEALRRETCGDAAGAALSR
ncbi:MAG: right-handed parallel beta-helix repeat-containing protein [Phenylobacterium sp.]|uniref:right-handed parallel beta-helix repeat-containing protein n=1 Tax=Phenylobacterium sp. TaxID=1871053 RepID=UPI001A36A16D|nr:right-handed parallel beta-helix repeat-containing protein [Phenylobacterium sp.]MBL8770981.1 right-handed parallel beta-helix repeat-containing protein [Phenylobacterium sp.]